MTGSHTPKITVGLPVYNGENLIGQCLEALAAQTYRDFVVNIYDNASTDGTGKIADRFARRDQRFRYHRNPENVGSAQNFIDLLDDAETEYFIWRADDDLSSADYLERLLARLENASEAALAAPRIEARHHVKNRTREVGFSANLPVPRVINIVRRMFLSHQSWIYGLWRTDALRRYYFDTWEKYPVGWANDHLVLLQVILDDAVVGDDRARFIQRIGIRKPGTPPPAMSYGERIAQATAFLERYRPLCREAVAERDWSGLERMILNAVIDRYAANRLGTSKAKMRTLRIKRALFESGT